MRIREVVFEGPDGLGEPVRYALGAGHAVVGPNEPLLGWLSILLFGGDGGAGWEGLLRVEVEEDGERRAIERHLGPFQAIEPLMDPAQAAARWLRPLPRPVVLSPQERERLSALLPQLEAELSAQSELERLDEELRALQHEIFTVDTRIEELERARAAEREALDRAAPFRAVELPADLDARLEAFDRALARRSEKEARLRKELDAVQQWERESPVDPLRDVRLWSGVGVGLGSMALGLLTAWKGLAILAIPAFGIPAAILLGAISASQQREQAARRRGFLEERLAELERSFASESRGVQELFAATGTESVEQFRAWLQAAREADEAARRATAAREAVEARDDIRQAAETKARLAREVETREKKMAGLAAGSFRSAGEIQREINEIRSRLSGEEERADASSEFVDAAAGFAGCDRATLLRTLGKRASQLLSALTDGKWKSVGWGASGGLAVKGDSGVARFPELSHEDREAARAALVFAVAEARGGPLLLDRPFDDLPAAFQARLARALKWLAGQGVQIVHRTEVAGFRRDAAVVEAA
nr:MAG: hypothetical protein DIU72_08770 [Pseudomonadota bacterium]